MYNFGIELETIKLNGNFKSKKGRTRWVLTDQTAEEKNRNKELRGRRLLTRRTSNGWNV